MTRKMVIGLVALTLSLTCRYRDVLRLVQQFGAGRRVELPAR